jgi:hypothetical protein
MTFQVSKRAAYTAAGAYAPAGSVVTGWTIVDAMEFRRRTSTAHSHPVAFTIACVLVGSAVGVAWPVVLLSGALANRRK